MISSLILATTVIACPRQAIVSQSYVQQYAAVQTVTTTHTPQDRS